LKHGTSGYRESSASPILNGIFPSHLWFYPIHPAKPAETCTKKQHGKLLLFLDFSVGKLEKPQ
jgi:hypothetical protein